MNINRNIKLKILLAGFNTLKEFAVKCGIAQSTLSNAIQGQKLSLDYKLKILRTLNKARKKLKEDPLTLYDIFPDTEKIYPGEIEKASA